MSPSTVQTSRFSFFSRDTSLAFAPCSTASTRAIESFQRNPNGGTNSSAAGECSAKKTKKVLRPIKNNWRIISWFRRVTYIETCPVVLVSFACIYNFVSVYASLAEARNCAHTRVRSTGDAQRMQRSVHRHDSKSVAPDARNFFDTLFFIARRDARFIFAVK